MESYGQMHDRLEGIEAEAWHDLYAAAAPAYAKENGLLFHRFGSGVGLSHAKLVSPEFARIVGAASLRELEAAIAWMDANSAAGLAVQVPVLPETTSVRKALESRGFRPRGNGWAKFISREASEDSTFHASLSARAIGKPDGATFGQIVQSAFGLPETEKAWFSELPGRTSWTVFLACWDSMPIACGALFAKGDRGWMGVDATLADFRQRGAQSMLIRARLEHGRQLGVKTFTAETGQPDAGRELEHTSFSNYRRAGFVNAYTRLNCVRST